MEVRIEDVDLGDALDRKVVTARDVPDCFGRPRVVDAKDLLLDDADVRVDAVVPIFEAQLRIESLAAGGAQLRARALRAMETPCAARPIRGDGS